MSIARSALQDRLDEWVAAGLLDADQAAALLAYDTQHQPARTGRVPLAAEAVGYIGSGLVLAAVALLIGTSWETMATPARIAALAVPTVVTALAGWWTARSDEPALRRLGSVLWLLAVAGVAGSAGEVWVDAIHDGDPPDHHAALFIGGLALLAAAPAWWVRRAELQQLALLAASITASLGIVDSVNAIQDRSMSALAVGLVLATIGAGWVTAGLARKLPPSLLATISGSALMLFGAQIIRSENDHVGLWLGIAAAAALMAVGVARSELALMAAGTAGLFQWTPQIALFYLEDTLGAEATLFIIGTMLIVLAATLARVYPRVTRRREAASASSVPKKARREGEDGE